LICMRHDSGLRTLIELVKLGARRQLVPLSTSELGRVLHLTQQGASVRLLELEKEGMIERGRVGRRLGVRLTSKGYDHVTSLYAELTSIINRREEFLFTGRVFSGMREGGYYVSLSGYKRQFRKFLGFTPYPGTLNLRLVSLTQIEQKRLLRSMAGISIAGFEDSARRYGPARCFRARIGETQKGAALVIERTHYDDTVLELISHANLRMVLRLKDGDELSATVHLD
jgi:riboflavin kinase